MRFIPLLFVFMMNVACADSVSNDEASATAAVVSSAPLAGPEGSALAVERLRQAFPGIPVGQIETSPVDGMWQVEVQGDWLHLSNDGRFLFAGELFELRAEGAVSLVEERQKALRVPGIAALQADEMVSFPAADEKAEVYVFTDVTCGYCRQLHREMSEYNKRGITVHYLAFPRGGVTSEGSRLLKDIWCSADRGLAMTEAKLEKPASQRPSACSDPVADHYALGQRFGVRGTPAVFSVDGEQLGGYVPPAKMAADLGLN
ncbi:MAG: protein-disulfide isomerase [Gammaproteobacteria bacterium HGW-Gammaproteobacteria-14]|nr:MAG: protein-disulfide isomerase [Gammaproteobacteria bacterium HGW-Gammaproteobacteria-14]